MKPIPGLRYHMVLVVCDEAGYPQDDDDDDDGKAGEGERVWECGSASLGTRDGDMAIGHICANSSKSFTNYQYQSGPADQASLILPPGTGIATAGVIVTAYHFFDVTSLKHGSTDGSAFELTFSGEEDADISPVTSLSIMAFGFVDALSVGSVTGSWTLSAPNELNILQLYSHWHESVLQVKAWIERGNSKQTDVILMQDPRRFAGYTDVSKSSDAVMRRGDRLLVTCTIANQMNLTLRVE